MRVSALTGQRRGRGRGGAPIAERGEAEQREPGAAPRWRGRDVAAGRGAVEEAGGAEQVAARARRQQLAESCRRRAGSISGEAATPENGLPTKIIVSAPSAMPALPSSASSP